MRRSRNLRYLGLIALLLCEPSHASFLNCKSPRIQKGRLRTRARHHRHHHANIHRLQTMSQPTKEELEPVNEFESPIETLPPWLHFFTETVRPIALHILQSLLLAALLISWEDVQCSYTLPSRSRVDLPPSTQWGAVTVQGLGFGYTQRLQLLETQSSTSDTEADPLWQIPSYNEVLAQHRHERVVRWNQPVRTADIPTSIHALCQIMEELAQLKGLAEHYQWDALRLALRTAPVTQLEVAASSLRALDPDAVIGFDWGSCAWRHCGALADAQEAMDELDHMTGVLEPYEALFCLDVVERAVRDMLATVPWKDADAADVDFWKNLAAYQPHQSTNAREGYHYDDSGGESQLDEAYARALFELRVD